MVQRALDAARAAGADTAEAGASLSRALTVTVRNHEVESLQFQRDRDLALTVYCGQRMGSATTADWSDDGLRAAAEAAVAIARASGEDRCNGLPDAADMATAMPDLDLFHPWMADADSAVELARACEQAGLDADIRIVAERGRHARYRRRRHGAGQYPRFSRHQRRHPTQPVLRRDCTQR